MAELIAQGRQADQRWRRPLPNDEPFIVGREAAPWSVPWDDYISRRHVQLTFRGGQLEVEKLASGKNPVFLDGQVATQFQLTPGHSFVIGKTTFTLTDEAPAASDDPVPLVKKRTFTAQELRKTQVRNAAHQIDVLTRLPEVISTAANDRELYIGLVNLLLAGIKHADAAALVAYEAQPGTEPGARIMSWDRRQSTEGSLQPSKRLIREAIQQQDAVLHVWSKDPSRNQGDGASSYTQDTGLDWAFCTPVRGEVSKGWAIYVAGRFNSELASSILDDKDAGALVDDLKFTELVAAIWSALHQVNQLKHRQASLSQFFSPTVLGTLANADPDIALKPRKADVTVMFCDLRGFSRQAEKRELLALLEGVSKALGFMTQNILDNGGVIGDFQGDAAMGFWGWPVAQPDTVKRACQAALGIYRLFQAARSGAGNEFQAGIGIASGPAVAGKIGTTDQVKVTVFGPVVNLASRLEGMTKILRVPILLDEATSKFVKEHVPTSVARLRRLAVVRPYGLDTSLTVSELLPPVDEYPLLNDAHLADYEAAVDAFLAGQWPQAFELLYKLPPQDRGKDFITAYIIQNNHKPPAGWDGVIPMSSKS